MKVCIESHTVKAFGEIPEGSLWDDDSPYIKDRSKFADVIEVVIAADTDGAVEAFEAVSAAASRPTRRKPKEA